VHGGQGRLQLVGAGKALALAEKTNDLYEKGAAYRDLGKAYELLHQEDSAYHYLELSRRATIDVYSKENNRQTAFLSVLFDIDKKNDEIVRLENTRKITIITTTSVIIVVILLVVLGAVIISRQRLKIRNDRLTGEQDRQIYLTAAELEDLSRRVGELLEPYARRVTDPESRPADARAAMYIQLGFPIAAEEPPGAGLTEDQGEAD